MGSYIASEIVKKMVQKEIVVKGAKALLLGFTFKENCPDFRNTRVVDTYHDLKEYGLNVTVYDPWVDKTKVQHEYGIEVKNDTSKLKDKYAAIILAVSHNKILQLNINSLKERKSILFDIKSFFPEKLIDVRL